MISFDIVEFCLTYRCNIRCNNCSNLCTQAPFTGDLSIDDVARFIHESVDSQYSWKIITIHGGEPALHSEFAQICGMLANYRDRFNRECRIWCLTNNSTEAIKKRLAFVAHEYRIGIGNADKVKANINPNGSPIPYVPVNDSPTDAGVQYTNGCFQPHDCGICFNHKGFWECSPAGAASRVFGWNPICEHVHEIEYNKEKFEAAFVEHCRHCGFAWDGREREINQVISSTWKGKLDEYLRTHDDCRTE